MPDFDLAALARTAVADVIGDLAHDRMGLGKLRDLIQGDVATQLAAVRAEVNQLRYERQLLGAARRILDLVASCEPRRWRQAHAEAEDIAQRIVDEIGHPVTDEPVLGPHYRGQIAALNSEVDRLHGENTRMAGEIAQLQALLAQAEEYARDLQDGGSCGGASCDPEPVHAIAVGNAHGPFDGLVYQGRCTCGWRSGEHGAYALARRAGADHADAKNDNSRRCDPALADNGGLYLACTGDDRADSDTPTPICSVEAGDSWPDLAADVAAHRCGRPR
jgi:hypothetical protein